MTRKLETALHRVGFARVIVQGPTSHIHSLGNIRHCGKRSSPHLRILPASSAPPREPSHPSEPPTRSSATRTGFPQERRVHAEARRPQRVEVIPVSTIRRRQESVGTASPSPPHIRHWCERSPAGCGSSSPRPPRLRVNLLILRTPPPAPRQRARDSPRKEGFTRRRGERRGLR